MWQQLVFLHDVAGHFPEHPQVPGFSIYQDLALHPSLSGGRNKRITCSSFFKNIYVTQFTITCIQQECSLRWISQIPKAPWFQSALDCRTSQTGTSVGPWNLVLSPSIWTMLEITNICHSRRWNQSVPFLAAFLTSPPPAWALLDGVGKINELQVHSWAFGQVGKTLRFGDLVLNLLQVLLGLAPITYNGLLHGEAHRVRLQCLVVHVSVSGGKKRKEHHYIIVISLTQFLQNWTDHTIKFHASRCPKKNVNVLITYLFFFHHSWLAKASAILVCPPIRGQLLYHRRHVFWVQPPWERIYSSWEKMFTVWTTSHKIHFHFSGKTVRSRNMQLSCDCKLIKDLRNGDRSNLLRAMPTVKKLVPNSKVVQ